MSKWRLDLILLALVISALLTTTEALASEITQYLDLSVSVNEVFSMSQDLYSLDFGSNDPGAYTPAKNLSISCKTNLNKPWDLSMYMAMPLSSDEFSIPGSNFYWNIISSTGDGALEAMNGYVETMPYTFYHADSSEWITYSPVDFTLQFYLSVPSNQAAGTYTTTVYIQMKDFLGSEVDVIGVDVNVEVSPRFTISAFPSTINFETVKPGSSSPELELGLSFTSNLNSPWSASLQSMAELTSGVNTIPYENFKWFYYKETGYGEEPSASRPISNAPYTFYYAAPNEYITSNPVVLTLTFHVDVPATQLAGSYTTTLVITMTQ